MGGLSVTDIRRERIPLLWSTVGETALPKGFYSNMGDTKKYPCVCRRANLLGRGVHSEKVREIGRSGVREEVVADSWQLVGPSLFWPGPVTNDELAGKIAHVHVCMPWKRSSLQSCRGFSVHSSLISYPKDFCRFHNYDEEEENEDEEEEENEEEEEIYIFI